MISCMISYMILYMISYICMISYNRCNCWIMVQMLQYYSSWSPPCDIISIVSRCMISYMISYSFTMVSCMIYVQDCVVLLAPYPNNPNQVESFNIMTDFDLQRVLNFSSTVPCVPQAPRGPGTVHQTRRFLSFTSARLSPSI
jgi:hypothetical protein